MMLATATRRLGTAAVLVAVAFVLTVGPGARAQNFPPPPANKGFISDFARTITPDAASEIARVQAAVFVDHDVPIVVVTIRKMADYGVTDWSIEKFAARWFDQWQIGKRTEAGVLRNRGVLVLVSVGDRKARIELGKDWGRSWDGVANAILEERMIPAFRDGSFSQGIVDGVKALGAMAVEDPSSPPKAEAEGVPAPVSGAKPQTSPFGPRAVFWMVGLGFLFLIAAVFSPGHRKPLLVAGIVLIALPLFFWLLLIILALFGRGGGGSGSSGGGFGSGGSSGGGGASGGW